jgi:hypothetical protein
MAGRLSSFRNCKVVFAGDLLAGRANVTSNKFMAAFSSWGGCPLQKCFVHLMALYMVDTLFNGDNCYTTVPALSQLTALDKQNWSDSKSLAVQL